MQGDVTHYASRTCTSFSSSLISLFSSGSRIATATRVPRLSVWIIVTRTTGNRCLLRMPTIHRGRMRCTVGGRSLTVDLGMVFRAAIAPFARPAKPARTGLFGTARGTVTSSHWWRRWWWCRVFARTELGNGNRERGPVDG